MTCDWLTDWLNDCDVTRCWQNCRIISLISRTITRYITIRGVRPGYLLTQTLQSSLLRSEIQTSHNILTDPSTVELKNMLGLERILGSLCEHYAIDCFFWKSDSTHRTENVCVSLEVKWSPWAAKYLCIIQRLLVLEWVESSSGSPNNK